MGCSVIITVRVTPRSSRDEAGGWSGDVLLVRLKASPVEGQANEALRRLLARRLNLRLVDVQIVSGAASRTKRVRLNGVEEEEMRQRLAV